MSCSQLEVLDDIPESSDIPEKILSINLTKPEYISVAVERKGTYFISESEAREKVLRFSSSNSDLGTPRIKSAT